MQILCENVSDTGENANESEQNFSLNMLTQSQADWSVWPPHVDKSLLSLFFFLFFFFVERESGSQHSVPAKLPPIELTKNTVRLGSSRCRRKLWRHQLTALRHTHTRRNCHTFRGMCGAMGIALFRSCSLVHTFPPTSA